MKTIHTIQEVILSGWKFSRAQDMNGEMVTYRFSMVLISDCIFEIFKVDFVLHAFGTLKVGISDKPINQRTNQGKVLEMLMHLKNLSEM